MYRQRKTIKEPYFAYSCAPADIPELEAGTKREEIINRLGYTTIASIDPANKNFALRIERRHHSGLVEPLLFDKTNIGAGYNQLTDLLDSVKSMLLECDYILIERQMPSNYEMVRVSQHCVSYFIITLRTSKHYPQVFELDPRLKGKMLEAPPVTYHELKKWGVRKALELCNERGDTISYEKLVQSKKADDLADSLIQIEAWWRWNSLN